MSAVVALAGAIVANVAFRTGAPLCRPDSLVQGHALWHVLTAGAAALWLPRLGRAPAPPRPADEPAMRVAD